MSGDGAPRRAVSVSCAVSTGYVRFAVVADDGTVWWMTAGADRWQPLPALPDRELSAMERQQLGMLNAFRPHPS